MPSFSLEMKDASQHGAQPFQYLFANPLYWCPLLILVSASLLDPSIMLKVTGSSKEHAKLIFLNSHKPSLSTPIFLRFQLSHDITPYLLLAWLILESQLPHPPEYEC
jgi:hypothetical protein